MKNQISRSVLKGVASVAVALLAGVGMLGHEASAGILNTKHNLSGTSTATPTGRVNAFTAGDGTGEICVFCHTPHGADTSAAVPLWNRSLGAKGENASYTTYNSLGTSSLDGATAPVGSVSLACLSCHDGTQAMNTMINQPGSGGYNPNGAIWAGTWANGGRLQADAAGKAGALGGTRDGFTNIALIGTDLRNDHPIGIQYAGGPNGALTQPGAADYAYSNFKDADFNTAQGAMLNGQPVWWVDTAGGTDKTREKSDIQLYTRKDVNVVGSDGQLVKNNGTAITIAGAQPYVECASCHDPHSENVTFLRMENGNKNSQICLACHNK